MSTIDRGGVSIFYEHHVSDPALPTILLSHGYSATSGMWDEQIEPLGQRYNVITWDMRGHGQSDSPDDPAAYSEANTVLDMAAILDACGVDRAVIGGLSLGGYMTLAFHLQFPERCRALMLFDTGPGYKKDEGRADWNKTAEARARAFEEKGLDALGGSEEVRIARHRSANGLALAARGMLAQFDDSVIQSLPHIDLPTLVLVGENDTPFLIATDYMASKIPAGEKAVIDAAGHAANIDQPEALNSVVLEFLGRVVT